MITAVHENQFYESLNKSLEVLKEMQKSLQEGLKKLEETAKLRKQAEYLKKKKYIEKAKKLEEKIKQFESRLKTLAQNDFATNSERKQLNLSQNKNEYKVGYEKDDSTTVKFYDKKNLFTENKEAEMYKINPKGEVVDMKNYRVYANLEKNQQLYADEKGLYAFDFKKKQILSNDKKSTFEIYDKSGKFLGTLKTGETAKKDLKAYLSRLNADDVFVKRKEAISELVKFHKTGGKIRAEAFKYTYDRHTKTVKFERIGYSNNVEFDRKRAVEKLTNKQEFKQDKSFEYEKIKKELIKMKNEKGVHKSTKNWIDSTLKKIDEHIKSGNINNEYKNKEFKEFILDEKKLIQHDVQKSKMRYKELKNDLKNTQKEVKELKKQLKEKIQESKLVKERVSSKEKQKSAAKSNTQKKTNALKKTKTAKEKASSKTSTKSAKSTQVQTQQKQKSRSAAQTL